MGTYPRTARRAFPLSPVDVQERGRGATTRLPYSASVVGSPRRRSRKAACVRLAHFSTDRSRCSACSAVDTALQLLSAGTLRIRDRGGRCRAARVVGYMREGGGEPVVVWERARAERTPWAPTQAGTYPLGTQAETQWG